LHIACQNQFLDIVNFLIDQKVNVNYQDNNGLTPLHYLFSGDIKVYKEKEITEFIISKPEKKINKIKRENLLELKKNLWTILNNPNYNYFFSALEKTLEENIVNNEEISLKIIDLKKKINESNINEPNLKLINETYLNYRKEIQEIILKKWNNFNNSESIELHDYEKDSFSFNNKIGIIKNANVKKLVKDNIKKEINEGIDLINNYDYNIVFDENNDKLFIGEYTDILWDNTFVNGNRPLNYPLPITFDSYHINDKNVINQLTKIYNKYKDINAYDLADNIIDLINLSFIGGSRKINIIDTNYKNLKTRIDTFTGVYAINKKVIFILLIEYFKNYTGNVINYIADNIRDPVCILINNFDFTTDYSFLFNRLRDITDQIILNFEGGINFFKYNQIINTAEEIYKDIFINKENNVGPIIYCKYLNTILRNQNTTNNLDCDLHKLFFKLVAALINDSINLETSFKNVLKNDNFCQINKYFGINPSNLSIIETRKGLAIWTAYLLTDGGQIDNKINLNIKNINEFINLDDLKPIKNIIESIIDPSDINVKKINENNNNDQNEIIIVKAILNYYNDLNIKFPKLYLLDLIYYILNIEKIQEINNYNFLNYDQMINTYINQLNSKNDIDIIFNQYQPSLHGYINILLEDPDLQRLMPGVVNPGQLLPLTPKCEYFIYKLKESIELTLLFNGCLPNYMKPDSINYNGQNPNVFNIILKKEIRNEIIQAHFIFNPVNNNGHSSNHAFNFYLNIFNDIPLFFNYFYEDPLNLIILTPDIKQNYFYYIEDRYRPPYVESKNKLLNNQLNSFNKILKKILNTNIDSFTNIFNSLLSKKQKISSIYYKLFVNLKLIFNNQENIKKKTIEYTNDNTIKLDYENNIKLFDFEKFTEKLNNINSNIFLYYYLYKNYKIELLPEFIYYKLNSNKYELYDTTTSSVFGSSEGNYELVGGSLDLTNLDFFKQYFFGLINKKNTPYIIYKNNALPPSLNNNLNDFYQLNKIKFIVEILTNIQDQKLLDSIGKMFGSELNINFEDKTSFVYFNVAKIIEEIIKDYANYSLKIAIDNKLLNNITKINNIVHDIELVATPFQVSTLLLQTFNDLNDTYKKMTNDNILLNFYKFSDQSINEKCNFIIYPNDYTSTDILQEKYCIKINDKIVDSLINNNAQPFLLDNNGKSCINSILSNFNYQVLQNKLINNIYFNENEFIQNELKNHIQKLYNSNFKTSIENFIKPQYKDIESLILSDKSYGNNILFNLKNSFKICFYLMNEYLTDYLWRFDFNYNNNNFNVLNNILNYKYTDINENYLINIANKYDNKIFENDKFLIQNELIDLLNIEKNKINKYQKRLSIEFNSFNNLNLNSLLIQNKINETNNQEIKINNEINTLTTNINGKKFKKINIVKKKIIKTYDEILNKIDKGINSSIWSLILDDETILNKSYNLSLLKILENQMKYNKDFKNEIYFDHISKIAYLYFENPKFINQKINKVMTYIYDVLIYLTKSQICFGIEIIFRKIIFNHIKSIYLNYPIDIITNMIDRIFNESFIYENNKSSFIEILYNIIPEKFVKNSILVFEDLDEKINFTDETPLDIIRDLVKILENSRGIINFTDELLLNLNNNIANYFDLFVGRTIKNWYVVCENILKFVINQHRITKTLLILKN
jgi:hypothetical protein